MAQPSSVKSGTNLSGISSIGEVLAGKYPIGARINIIGIVTDFRAPIPTIRTDWKCQIRIYDKSVEDEDDNSVLLNIFGPEDEMPEAKCGDVIVVFAAKVQRYQSGPISLCTHWTTDVHIYMAGKIPKAPGNAIAALQPARRKKVTRHPNKAENELVCGLYGSINKDRLPTESEFEEMKIRSINVRDKFSELKDVRDGMFVDTIVQIVKEPYDLGDKFTVWVSDFTENTSFYNYSFAGGASSEAQSWDPYGYGTKPHNSSEKSEWAGPFGKRSMQVTCFEPHASVIRNEGLSTGSWISLRNLQIKPGHSMANLEGFLREDRAAQGIKINISSLDLSQDRETLSPRLIDAVRRKRDYENDKKKQLKSLTDAANAGRKRKAALGMDSEPASKKHSNAKSKRKANRAKKFGHAEQPEAVEVTVEDLNTRIKCENKNKQTSSLADILAPIFEECEIGGKPTKLKMPFTNAKYRSHVRVVNFLPSRLEDFAYSRKKRSLEDALLIDDGDGSQSESDSEQDEDDEQEEDENTIARFAKPIARVWEWRFYLQLEDAVVDDGQKKKTVWVAVDNLAAQLLLGLDACDLTQNDIRLGHLRQKMFQLWGDLEEYKAKVENRALQTRTSNHAQPPPDSSDDEQQQRGKSQAKEAKFSNRPFSCCIQQYGVKVKEPDETLADAGECKRWQRMYGLFGTQIAGA